MSVFQLQEYWGLKVTQEAEEFDLSCFAIGNADNSNPPSDKIVVGSQQGILRVYSPTKPGYRIEDLLYEGIIDGSSNNNNNTVGAGTTALPILQVLVGKFLPGSELIGIAVLQPRHLTVFELIPQGARDGRVTFHSLQRAYRHNLGISGKHFTAYNMCSGPFGGIRGRDMILVQSMDGKLQIFEQSANAFSRQLVDCLIPGPIIYVPKIDAFVTVNHACQAECYRYQVLASSQGDIVTSGVPTIASAKSTASFDLDGKSSAKDITDGISSLSLQKVRATLVEWSISIGESCRQILLGNFTGSNSSTTDSRNRSNNSLNELLFVCDKSLFLIKADTGGMIQQRKLDRVDASCAAVIPTLVDGEGNSNTGPVAKHNFMLVMQDGTVQIYTGFNLTWAARLPFTAVHTSIATFHNHQGMIVAIDDRGHLSINYLGTKPPVTTILTQVRDLDYDKIDEEHRALLQIIRESQQEQKNNNNEQQVHVDRILIKAQVGKTFDTEMISLQQLTENYEGAGDVNLPAQNQFVPIFPPNNTITGNSDLYVKIIVRYYLTYTGDKQAQKVSLVFSGPDHAFIFPKAVVIPKVGGLKSTPVVVKVHIYALKTALLSLPHSLDLVSTASYQSMKGEPKVSMHSLNLPLHVMCRPKAPSKTANCKLVLDTDVGAMALTDLFSDLLYAYQEAGVDVQDGVGNNAVQALGFQLFVSGNNASLLSDDMRAAASNNININNNMNTTNGGALVSILVSKNAGRYRLQADTYPAIYLVLQELEKRLNTKINAVVSDANGANSNVSNVAFSEALPLDEYFQYIQQHLALRHQIIAAQGILDQHAQLFRSIQKRLLVRYKDRNATPLHGLDILMKEVYDRITKQADEIQLLQQKLAICSGDLAAFSKLLATLAAMKFRMNNSERAALMSHLCPDVKDSADQGWEETVAASLSHLLRTTLSKHANKDHSSAAANNAAAMAPLEMPKTIDNLRKIIMVTFDRLEKGGSVLSSAPASTTTQSNASENSRSNLFSTMPASSSLGQGAKQNK